MRHSKRIFINVLISVIFTNTPNILQAQENPSLDSISISEILMRTDQPHVYDNKGVIRLWVNAYSQSNSVPSEFSNAFVFPEFITEEIKSEAFSRLKRHNRFGGEFNRGAELGFAPDSSWRAEGKQLSFRYKNSTLFGAAFGEDIFKLIFNGNKQFRDETATLDNTRLSSISFESLEFGFLKTNYNSLFSVHLGIVKGNALSSIDLAQGSLYTSPNGDLLDLAWQGDYTQSSGGNRLKDNPSIGASLSLNFIQKLNDKWILKESVQDLGFVVWNSATRTSKIDTAFSFTGIQLGSILDISDSKIVLADSLENKVLGSDIRQSTMIALPTLVQFDVVRIFKNRISIGAGIKYRYMPGFIPLTEANISKGFGKNRSIKFTLAYGGFGQIQSGLSAVVFSNHHHSMRIGTIFNEGFISPSSLSGAGIQIHYVHHI